MTTRPDRNRYIFAILLGLSFLIFAYVITRPNAETRAVVGERFAIDYPDVDRKVTYYVAGSGTNILLYGGTGREVSDLNELVIDLNEAGYRTLTIGTPGISTHPPEDLNLSSYITPMENVLAAAVLDHPFCLVGYDFGSDVVRDIVPNLKVTKPEAIVLLSGNGDAITRPEIVKHTKTIFNDWALPFSRINAVKKSYFAKENEIPNYWKKGWRSRTARWQLAARNNSPRTLWNYGNQVPTLLVQGAEDQIFTPEEIKTSLNSQNIVNYEVSIINKSGHALLPEKPREISETVIKFLNNHCLGPT